MNKILALLLLIFAISCQSQKKNTIVKVEIDQASELKKLAPKEFISALPSELSENSGIIIYDNLIWTINDSGGKNVLYGFNFKGEIEKEIEIKDAPNRDWEDITQDKKHIYVGDFGNNSGMRKDQTIYKIKKKDISKKQKQKVKSKKIEFDYANQIYFMYQGQRTPFDCEALVEFNDSLYVFTKDWSDRTTTVYKMPTKKGEYKIDPIAQFNVDGLITGADISPDKSKLVLAGYKDYKPILWIFSDFKSNNFFEGKQMHFEMDAIFDAQTEGVCFLGNDSLLISCEQTSSFKHQLFLIDLTTLK